MYTFKGKGYRLPLMGTYVRFNADRQELRYVVGYIFNQSPPEGVEPHFVVVTDMTTGEVTILHHSMFNQLIGLLGMHLVDGIIPIIGTYDKIVRELA